MGLLNRARVLDDTPGSAGGRDTLAKAEQLISSFRHQPEQLDYPVEVFNSFKILLGFHRGSLLFPDSDKGEYYPWITTGLDRTTTRRMRIPMNFPSLSGTKSGSIIEIDGDLLSPMLSNRESGLAGPIHLLTLGSTESPDGLVLAMDADIPSIETMNEATGILNRSLGINIIKSRNLLENVGTDDPVDPADWLDGWGDQEAWLVTLDATAAIETLMEAIEGLELYRARRDVIALIRRINGRMGRTYDMKDGRVLILFPADRMPDRELYIHQLTNSFCASILNMDETPVFPVVFNRWPEEKDEVKSALSGFFRE